MPHSKSRKFKSAKITDLNIVEKPIRIGSLKRGETAGRWQTYKYLGLRLLDPIPRGAAAKLSISQWPELAECWEKLARQKPKHCDAGRLNEWARQAKFAWEVIHEAETGSINRVFNPTQFTN